MLGEDGELIDGEGAEEQAGADALVAVEQAFIRQRALRIQVGDKPLIVRAEAALTSEQIGMLLPNQMVTVVEERITEVRSPTNARTRTTCALPPFSTCFHGLPLPWPLLLRG